MKRPKKKHIEGLVLLLVNFYERWHRLPAGALFMIDHLSKHPRCYLTFSHLLIARSPATMAALLREQRPADDEPECDAGPCPEQELILHGKSKHIEPEFMRGFQ